VDPLLDRYQQSVADHLQRIRRPRSICCSYDL
jgi:hypothetical protein